MRQAIHANARAPACMACDGIVKSATISFGQAMPEQAMADARAATFNADLFLAIGSSLQVFPAAGFPVMAKQNRTPLVIVNREPTGLDGLADLVVNDEIGAVLHGVSERLYRRGWRITWRASRGFFIGIDVRRVKARHDLTRARHEADSGPMPRQNHRLVKSSCIPKA